MFGRYNTANRIMIRSTSLCISLAPVLRHAQTRASPDEAAKSLEKRLQSIGRVNWQEFDPKTPEFTQAADRKRVHWQEISSVHIDPKTYTVSYSATYGFDDITTKSTYTLFLDELGSIPLMTLNDWNKRTGSALGDRERTPMPYSVGLVDTNYGGDLRVPTRQAANQIALEFRQLKSLCQAKYSFAGASPDAGAGLPQLLRSVADNLNQQGKLTWTETLRTPARGDAGPTTRSLEVSNAAADAKACAVTFRVNRHSGFTVDGRTTNIDSVEDATFSLRRVQQLDVMDLQGHFDREYATFPVLQANYTPNLFLLVITQKPGLDVSFTFSSREVAESVAGSMVEAVEQCSGVGKGGF